MTADKIIPSTLTGAHNIYRSFTGAINTQYCLSVFAKADGYPYLRIDLSNTGFTSNGYAFFNLTTGAVESVGAGVVTYGAKKIGDFWRLYISVMSDADGGSYTVQLYPAQTQDNVNSTGDGVAGVIVAGVMVHVGDRPLPYIGTGTGAVSTTAETLSLSGVSATNTTRITTEDAMGNSFPIDTRTNWDGNLAPTSTIIVKQITIE
jgi:opacity protein-like surface antigen